MANGASSRLQDALQSTLFWGALCMFATIVLTVVAVMIHDFRWILGFAWPFAAVAAWEFSRIIFARRLAVLATTAVSMVASGALLLWLYFALAPPPESVADKPIAAPPASPAPELKPEPPKQAFQMPAKTNLRSTLGRMLFKCAPPDDQSSKAIERARVGYKNYVKIFSDTYGVSIKILDVPGGDKVEMTAANAIGQKYMGLVSKATIEVRHFSPTEILGVYTAEFAALPYPAAFAGQSIALGSDQEIAARTSVERLANAGKGGCTLR
jgi:hypothetical protein